MGRNVYLRADPSQSTLCAYSNQFRVICARLRFVDHTENREFWYNSVNIESGTHFFDIVFCPYFGGDGAHGNYGLG